MGASQTEAAIPRILERFQTDLKRLNLPHEIELPNHCLDKTQERVYNGGIYSWNPSNWHPSRTSLTCHNVLPYLVVILATATGMLVSALVPPDGWDCRHYGELGILIAWLLSAQADGRLSSRWPLHEDNEAKLFWITDIKDLLTTIATMGGVIVTQVGVFNRCSCYTKWGRTGLALPQMPDVARVLFHRLTTAYPATTFTSIGVMLIIIPLFICIRYMDALRTFVQRDDQKSNAQWLWKIVKRYQALEAKLRMTVRRIPFGLSRTRRTATSIIEEGPPGESNEMRPLTQALSEEPENMTTENSSIEASAVAEGGAKRTIFAHPSSQSSGVDPPSRSGSDIQSELEPRRRNIDRESLSPAMEPSSSRDGA